MNERERTEQIDVLKGNLFISTFIDGGGGTRWLFIIYSLFI
jgi:hypothetical protein